MGSLPILQESDPDEHALAGIARDLSTHLCGEVRFSSHDRMLYATDASIYQVEPIGVVIPASVDDAAKAVQFCAQRGLAILPRGAGTSLAGQCVNRAVVIDFSPNCRAVRSVDASARRCEVEPGLTIDELNEHLAPTGLFFAPDPATSRHANIGGCVGNNAAGARSIRYGRTSENIAALEVEEVLLTHPAVAQCAVVAVPDDVRGEEVAAFVVASADVAATEETAEAIVRFCLDRLAYYKAPGWISVVDALPATPTNKVRKQDLAGLVEDANVPRFDLRQLKRAKY